MVCIKTLLENQPHNWVFWKQSQLLESIKIKICQIFFNRFGVLQKLLIFKILVGKPYE